MSRVVLASFDVVPSAKGASRHILRNAEILREAGHEVSLVTLGRGPAPGYRHRPIPIEEPNWLRRALAFREAVTGFDKPVLAFCATGRRSATTWALAARDRLSTDEVVRMAATAGVDLEPIRDRLDSAS